TYTVEVRPGAGVWSTLGLEVVQDESLPSHRVARGADRLVVSEVEAELAGRRLPFVLASSAVLNASHEHHAMTAIDGDARTGWGVVEPGNNNNLFLALRFSIPVETAADSVLTVRVRHDSTFRRATLGRFRIALARGLAAADRAGLPAPLVKALGTPEEKRTEPQSRALVSFYEYAARDLQPLLVEAETLEAALGALEAEIPRVIVTRSTRPRETRVLSRGNWMDDSGDVIEPAPPAFLHKAAGRATRLDLANWLVSRDNPLTARVFVNRAWRQMFGAGLSKSLDDLGSQGDWPTHPELLDWLAAEFMERWDVKHLLRTIVTSRAYRQSSLSTPQLDERDPDNRLLARQSRYRVDAESVRDIALAASGLLVEKFGGPSVRPYQPEGYLAALNFPKREYSASHGPDLYRRGVYTFWQRTFLHPSMATFDASTREECAVGRSASNTPLQALSLLNDPIYVEAARVLAQNMMKDGGPTLAARIGWAFRRATGRAPTAAESATLADLYRKNLERFRADPAGAKQLLLAGEAPRADSADPAELAALTTIARAVLNLHETVTRN
ncbi:MAG: DUF1553 domain-containing protein, partial [Bryobacteraceae bacterium]